MHTNEIGTIIKFPARAVLKDGMRVEILGPSPFPGQYSIKLYFDGRAIAITHCSSEIDFDKILFVDNMSELDKIILDVHNWS
jgi:hypothetical protein